MTQETTTVPPFNLNPQTISWERLEAKRLNRLGLINISPRSYNVLRTSLQKMDNQTQDPLARLGTTKATFSDGPQSGIGSPVKANSMAPWSSLGKPTCGYFFNDRTDNKKKNFGIPPSNLVKWRNFSAN